MSPSLFYIFSLKFSIYLKQNHVSTLGFIFYPTRAENWNVLFWKDTISAPGGLYNFFIYRWRKVMWHGFYSTNTETHISQELTSQEGENSFAIGFQRPAVCSRKPSDRAGRRFPWRSRHGISPGCNEFFSALSIGHRFSYISSI